MSDVYMAKLAEQAERYEEMVEYMKAVATAATDDLSLEERNLLSVAYKNVVGARRASLRIIGSIEAKEIQKEGESGEKATLIKGYKAKVEEEKGVVVVINSGEKGALSGTSAKQLVKRALPIFAVMLAAMLAWRIGVAPGVLADEPLPLPGVELVPQRGPIPVLANFCARPLEQGLQFVHLLEVAPERGSSARGRSWLPRTTMRRPAGCAVGGCSGCDCSDICDGCACCGFLRIDELKERPNRRDASGA